MLQRVPVPLRELLATAVTLGETAGVRLWLVGGCVRDLLLARPLSRDLDVAVEGEVGPLAEALAAATGGRVVATHAPFGTATVEVPGAAACPPTVIDLARTRSEQYPRPAALPEVTPAPLAADLARRDFSVNALALELHCVAGALRDGLLHDPFGGQADLVARRLRLLHAHSLRDDPTRLLRGLRLATRLGLTPEPATRQQIAAALAAGYLALLTPERSLAEFCLALEEPRPDAVLRRADEWGVTPQLFSTLAWSAGLAARCDRYAADQHRTLEPLVWAGLLLYDLAAPDLAALAARYPLPTAAANMMRQVAPLQSLAPGLAGLPKSVLDHQLRPFSTPALAVLHYAEPSASAAVALYLHTLRAMRAPLDGHDLRALGVAPGPALGRLLEALRVATLDGRITTRAEAEALVREGGCDG